MTTQTPDDYVGRITPWQARNPNFVATVRGLVAPHADAGALVASLPEAFDLDEAVGAQLDVVGEWVGRSRRVLFVQISPYFAFDKAARGWDQAPWKGPYDEEFGVALLDDETYRRLLQAKVLANAWDGTVPGAQAALDAFFDDPATRVVLDDRAQAIVRPIDFAFDRPGAGWDQGQWRRALFAFDVPGCGFDESTWSDGSTALAALDMEVVLIVAGKIPGILDLALLSAGAIPIKPAGVSLTYAVTTVDHAPVFGFDVDNDLIGGWDRGAWGASPDYVATHL